MNYLGWVLFILLFFIGQNLYKTILMVLRQNYKEQYSKVGNIKFTDIINQKKVLAHSAFIFKIFYAGNFIDKGNKKLNKLILLYRLLIIPIALCAYLINLK
jgi:hypothetical protein